MQWDAMRMQMKQPKVVKRPTGLLIAYWEGNVYIGEVFNEVTIFDNKIPLHIYTADLFFICDLYIEDFCAMSISM